MIKESEFCSTVIESLVMIEKDCKDLKDSTNCWICKKTYEEGEAKVKTYNHISGKYLESAHQKCDPNLSLTKKIPVLFHNLQKNHSHFIFQEIGKNILNINVIPKTIEKYISFYYSTIKKRKALNEVFHWYSYMLFVFQISC